MITKKPMKWLKQVVGLAALGSSTAGMAAGDIRLDPEIKNRGNN